MSTIDIPHEVKEEILKGFKEAGIIPNMSEQSAKYYAAQTFGFSDIVHAQMRSFKAFCEMYGARCVHETLQLLNTEKGSGLTIGHVRVTMEQGLYPGTQRIRVDLFCVPISSGNL